MTRVALLLLLLVVGLWSWLGRSRLGSDENGSASAPGDVEPGYVAQDAELIETGEDGQPLYRLHASRIEQAQPAANVFLAEPHLAYRPNAGSEWTLAAERGVLEPAARVLQLYGSVQAQGSGTAEQPLAIRTERLAIDMLQQHVSSDAPVAIDWGRLRLTARGLQINLKAGTLRLESEGHAEILR
jgi:LPS export ABC transporter protein LptC